MFDNKNLTFAEESVERPDAIDTTDGTVIYLGYSQGASSMSEPKWKIRRITIAGSVVTVEYPNGLKHYAFSFAQRAAYGYRLPL